MEYKFYYNLLFVEDKSYSDRTNGCSVETSTTEMIRHQKKTINMKIKTRISTTEVKKNKS